jgi:hypothetical protein
MSEAGPSGASHRGRQWRFATEADSESYTNKERDLSVRDALRLIKQPVLAHELGSQTLVR